MSRIEKLLSVSSGSLSLTGPSSAGLLLTYGRSGSQLLSMLEMKNGFYAFESALHVFPASKCANTLNIEDWNADDLWKRAYGDMMAGYLCFAEDAFGCQFAIRDDAIHFVDAETAEPEKFARDIEEWAMKVLDDFEVHTGYTTAHHWQAHHGPLKRGHRLIPKIPFVCGGNYHLDNLYSGDAITAMRFRGSLAQQIRDIPDGTTVELRVE